MGKVRSKSKINITVGKSFVLQKVVNGVNAAAQEGENAVIDMYSLPPERTGKKYSSLPNRSSAPGESPAPQSGQTRQGVAHVPARIIGGFVRAVVSSRSKLAVMLELGTEKMEPRPTVSKLRDDPVLRKRLLKAFARGARR